MENLLFIFEKQQIALNIIGNMGTWSTAIKGSDEFLDIYDDFFDLYHQGKKPEEISKSIIEEYKNLVVEDEEEKYSLWFALALAQWETKTLDSSVLSQVEHIITSGEDLAIWRQLGASEADIKRRKIALDKFLEKIKSDRPKAKPRKRPKHKTPIFSTGDCLIYKMSNGNYGGAIVLATDPNPETACNLVATTRLNQVNKPTIEDFENTEILVCNFGKWEDDLFVCWQFPDLFYKDFSDLFEVAGKIDVQIDYLANNADARGYMFEPTWTLNWDRKIVPEMQFESETTKPKPTKTITVKQMTKVQ